MYDGSMWKYSCNIEHVASPKINDSMFASDAEEIRVEHTIGELSISSLP